MKLALSPVELSYTIANLSILPFFSFAFKSNPAVKWLYTPVCTRQETRDIAFK